MLKKLVALTALATCTCAAFAQGEDVRPIPGDREIGVGGQWMTTNGNDIAHLTVDFTYHFKPQFAGEIALMYLKVEDEDAYGLSAVGKLLLSKEGATTPYLQAGGIYYDGQGESDATFILGAGVEHYISKTQAFYLDLKAFRPSGMDDWMYMTSIGFRFVF